MYHVHAGAPWAESVSYSPYPSLTIIIIMGSISASRWFLFSSNDPTDSTIPGVLFPGSCWPDCTLSLHALRLSSEGDRGVTQSLATPAGGFPASVADGLLWTALAKTIPSLTVFTPLALVT